MATDPRHALQNALHDFASEEAIETLLRCGAGIFTSGFQDMTCLAQAFCFNPPSTFALLLRLASLEDVSALDSDGYAMLNYMACGYYTR
jgi:hypothetical protein